MMPYTHSGPCAQDNCLNRQAASANSLLSAFNFNLRFGNAVPKIRGWLFRLQNPRRNQYKPLLYGLLKKEAGIVL